MNTKNWKLNWAEFAIRDAGVRPWFQEPLRDAIRRGQYFFFNKVNGRVVCLGTCPSSSLAFSYAASWTAVPITVFVIGPTGPVIAQAGDPDAGELWARWIRDCEQTKEDDAAYYAMVNAELDHEIWLDTMEQFAAEEREAAQAAH